MKINLTYNQLSALIREAKLNKPLLDIGNQPVTLTDPQDSNSYYNITGLVKEEDGHFSLVQE
jgi:hypothetical protein